MSRLSGFLRSRHFVFAILLVAAAGMTACVPKTRITTEPQGAIITVKNASGQVIRQQPAPVEFDTSFSGTNDRYIIEAKPATADAEAYRLTTDEMTSDRYSGLPSLSENLRQLHINLEEKEYRQLKTTKAILDPKKGWVGFITEERAYRDVFEQGGAVPTRVVDLDDNATIMGMAISPDGSKIVFSTAEYDTSNAKMSGSDKTVAQDGREYLPLKHANLRGVKVTGGGIQHITAENFKDMYPSFTSEGKYLLFCSNRRRPNSMDILRTGSDGRSGISNIYIDRSAKAVKPTQAEDKTIVFAVYPEGWRQPSDVQIWTVGGPNEFPTQIALGMQPVISPDGKHIAYIGTDGNLWAVNADGKDATQLTVGAEQLLQEFKKSLKGQELEQFKTYERSKTLLRHYYPYAYPSWTADGGKILYSSMAGTDSTGRPNHDIWVMNRDGTGNQQLTTNGSVDRFPLMSPDKQYVYFMSNRGLKWAIWRISASDVVVQ